MLQRSKEWFDARNGRFTASEIHRLLGKETLKTTKTSIDSFAFEKAVETLYGVEVIDFVSKDMERGITLEPLAFNLFKELQSFEFKEVTNCGFFEYGNHAGASPDGLVSDNAILEIKCPRRNKFFKLVANGESEIDSKYIAQMQMQMLATGREKAYFFNYYLEDAIQYWHTIEILRDEEMIEVLKERIEMAGAIKNEYIEKINNNAQF